MRTYGLAPETRQYLRRLYAYGRELKGDDISDIDNFVRGLKQLNLWGNTVCWPMRSIHNIGTGSTVLSLGGGGVYNGTMVNSPTWGTEGITNLINNSNVYINVPTLIPSSPAAGLITCFKPLNAALSVDWSYLGNIDAKFMGLDGVVGGNTNNPAARIIYSGVSTILDLVRYASRYSIISMAYSGTGSFRAMGNTTRTTSVLSGQAKATTNLILMNAVKSAGSAPQTNAFCAYLTSGMYENHIIFYRLLKTTICRNLDIVT